MQTTQIRRAQWGDLLLIEALDAQIQPYRPEEQDLLEPMYARSLAAEQANDPRWLPITASPSGTLPSEANPFPDMDAFWVAFPYEEHNSLAGIVGVQTFQAGDVMGQTHPLAQEWGNRPNVAELRRLRVLPEYRGQGLGMRLCQTVIDWSRKQGYDTLIVNTTTPQLPARNLYAKLGFHERGLSFIGRYELVWMEMPL